MELQDSDARQSFLTMSCIGRFDHTRKKKLKSYGLINPVFRMGLLAVLRSKFKSGQTIGIMITASHNPGPDNGVKLVDPAGEMLEQEWEGVATKLANCDDAQVQSELESIVTKYGIDLSVDSLVVVGRDTRWCCNNWFFIN